MAAKTSEETEAQPTNVIEALCRVAAEIGGIEKLTTEQRRARGLSSSTDKGVTFAYRSIDQVTQAAQPLFARYQVVVVPILRSVEVKDIVVNGNPWTDTSVAYDWDIYGPGGTIDVIHAATAGLGRDNSDKGFGKAMTNAYKNLVLRLLTIGDPADEIDHDKHETDRAPAPPSKEEQERFDRCAMVWELCKDLKNLDGADGPHISALRVEVGGRTVKEIQSWIEEDVDVAEAFVKTQIELLKAGQAEPEMAGGDEPPKTRQRAKAGSAVKANEEALKAAFPGAEEVPDGG
jgi:hypothetical protein